MSSSQTPDCLLSLLSLGISLTRSIPVSLPFFIFFSSSYILIPSLYFCRFPFLFFHQHRLEKLWWPQGTRRQSRSRELDRPWRIRGLGRPWRIRGLERSWRSSEHGQQWRVLRRYRGPSPRLGLYGRTPTTPPKYSLDKVDA